MAPTQAALYEELADDLHLSWSEAELPERERTKHVHRLHPYLGKFIPQLVEALLGRYVRAGGRVLDPFAGSGTTLVQALESGHDAVGIDIASFNCLVMRVKTARYDTVLLERELRDAASRLGVSRDRPSGYVREWYAAAGRRGARPLPLAHPRLRARGRAQGRACPRGAVGAFHDPLRPRVPESPSARPLLVPQAPPDLQAGRGGEQVPDAVPPRHARSPEGVPACSAPLARGGGRSRRRP